MPTEAVYFITISLIVIGTLIYFNAYLSTKRRILRALQKHPFSRIGLLEEGAYAKVKGTVDAITTPLQSPIGQQSCVYYEIIIEQKRSNGKTSHWDTIIREQEFAPFMITANGEKVIVDPAISNDQKRVFLTKHISYTSGTWKKAPDFLEAYLAKHAQKSTTFFGINKTLRYREGSLQIGEQIAVMGLVTHKEGTLLTDRYHKHSVYISGDDKHMLHITDDPKALQTTQPTK